MLNKVSVDKSSSLEKSLLHYRSTPIPDLGLSPSELLMSRRLRTSLPIRATLLKPFVVENVKEKLLGKQEKMKLCYDKSVSRPSGVGEYVYLQNSLTGNWEPGIVVEVCVEPRSYMVDTGNSILRRNEIFIKPRSGNFNVYHGMNPVLGGSVVSLLGTPPIENVNDEIPVDNVINEIPIENVVPEIIPVENVFPETNGKVQRTRTRVVKPKERLNL